ncbi:MAG: OmpA family protein [Deltaproteobacteria bacterium]|nr:OmpA family protein [Deltaproteobacteria bacterium]
MRTPSLVAAAAALGVALAGSARADNSSGVDSALFRPTIDTTGVFSLDGARPMPRRDLVWKILLGYAQQPFAAPVPGIGGVSGDTGSDAILDYAATLDFTFALALSQRLTIGFDAAAYRAAPAAGYGKRGRYSLDSSMAVPSTGLLSLRPLTNLDPSQSSSVASNNSSEMRSGPLDVRVTAKYALTTSKSLSSALIVTAGVPFGEDQMFLGDAGPVIEPKLAIDYRLDKIKSTRIVANLGARLRKRTVLEAYDPNTQTDLDSKVVLDVGSELMAGVGAQWELSPRIALGVEDVVFIPLTAASLGDCAAADGRRCSSLMSSDYFAGGKAGDFASYAVAGATVRASGSLALQVMGGAGYLGHRGDQFHVTIGAVWSPQPAGSGDLGRADKDGDEIPDTIDVCPDDPEDRDGYQDDDGCPELDNDGDGVPDVNDACANEPEDKDDFQDDDGCPDRDNDGDSIPDVTDKCPNDKEDLDGYEDDDGCPEEDNDGDGFPDGTDKCPNDPETVNGVDDDDGCPDTRTQTGPEEAADRINLRGNKIEFGGNTATLTNASKVILGQVGQLIKDRGLTVRVEVHVALGTRSKNAGVIARQKKADKALSSRRAQAVLDYLVAQGVPLAQLQAVGLGSDRPLGNNPPDDPLNERVDFIKSQQRAP